MATQFSEFVVHWSSRQASLFFAVLKYEIFVVVLGTAKYNLPSETGSSGWFAAAPWYRCDSCLSHGCPSPSSTISCPRNGDGELKDLLWLPDIGGVPDPRSLAHRALGWAVRGTRDSAESQTDIWWHLTGSQVGKPARNLPEDLPEVISCYKTRCLGLIGSLQGKSVPLKNFQLGL